MDGEQIELTAFTPGQRLDRLIVAKLGNLSRARVQTLIKDGLVMVDGKSAKPGVKLKGGERVIVTLPATDEESVIQPENIPLQVMYEDEDIAVMQDNGVAERN